MKIIHTKLGIQQAVFQHKCQNKTIGLVPTMGALHKGHLGLVEKSKNNSDITVVSIFINPAQFTLATDLEQYPRTLDQDLEKLQTANVDYVFVPEVGEIYEAKPQLKFDFFDLEKSLEGAFRPGHFNGVGIIVSKLFNIVHPDQVYFGQKDLQQVAIIKRMVEDLSFMLEILVVPTIREQDGLALSSRNTLMNPGERAAAVILYNSLQFAKDELLKGLNWFDVKQLVHKRFQGEPLAKLEYFELVKTNSMEQLTAIDETGPCSLCTSAFIGNVRLIDNMTVTS